jgi:hypothetical protein
MHEFFGGHDLFGIVAHITGLQFRMASSTDEMGSISGAVGISQKSIVSARGISTNRTEDVLDFASIRPGFRRFLEKLTRQITSLGSAG